MITIAKAQLTQTHEQTPYTLIDSGADSGYVSEDLLVHRSMGEMLSTTQQDRVVSSGKAHHQTSGESTTLVADGSVSLTNAKDNIVLSAHTGRLEATAKQDVNIASSTQAVEIVASNKVTINAGGASITLDGGDITIQANEFTEKAGKHSPAKGGFDGLGLGGLPSMIPDKKSLMDGVYNLAYHFVDDDGKAIENNEYIILDENAELIETGMTSQSGQTKTVHTPSSKKLVAFLKIEDGWDYDL